MLTGTGSCGPAAGPVPPPAVCPAAHDASAAAGRGRARPARPSWFAAATAELCDGPPAFYDLDVIEVTTPS